MLKQTVELGQTIRVAGVEIGQRVVAITGSTKTGDWRERPAVVDGFHYHPVTEHFGYLEAIVTFDDGTKAKTHRLK